jgi:hypothetical protein
MVILNSNQQQIIGWLSAVPSGGGTTTSTLSTSLYAVWNGDISTTTLATGAYGAWNGEGAVTAAQLTTSAYGAWNGEKSGASLDSNIFRVYTGNDLNDTSGNAQNATNVGGVTFTAGKFGNAFTFNGSNNISLPDNSLNSLTGDFTVSMWVKVQNTGYLQTLFSSLGTDGTNYYGFAIHNYGGTYTTIFNGTAAGVALNELSPNPYNTWYNLVVTRKAGTRTRIYYNGSLTRENSDARNAVYYSGTNRVNIGAYGSTSYRVTNGTQIDAVTIWNKELNLGEVLSLYNDGTGAEYPYSSLTLPSSDDAIGSNTGTLMNGCTLTAGKIGKGFYFDGVNDYIALPSGSVNYTGDFSVSGWVFIPTQHAQNGNYFLNILSNVQAPTWFTNPNGWRLYTKGNNVTFETYNNGSETYLTIPYIFTTSTWAHVSVSRKAGSGTKLYVNGNLIGSNTSTVDPTYLTGSQYIPTIGVLSATNNGGQGGTYAPAGTIIDAVTTWQRELSADEMAALYNSGSGNQYPFSNVSISSPSDSVSTNNGTIVGGVTYTTGIVGNAFTFNGTSGYVSLPNNSFNFTGDFSISAWVNIPSAPSSAARIFSNDNYDVVSQYGYGLYVNTNKTISFFIGSSIGTSTVTSTTALALNTWYHITVKRDSVAKQSVIYINGVNEAQATNTNLVIGYGTRAIQPTIGAYRGNNQGVLSTSNYMVSGGKIDALTIWNKKITDDEITQLYNLGGGIQYPFTTQTIKTPYAVYNGDSLIDPIGAKNATINGGVTYTTGKIGNAYTFNGSTGYLTLPVGSLNLAGSFSFSMWLNFNGTPANYATILSNILTGNYQGFLLAAISDSLFIQLGNGSGTWVTLQGPPVTEFTNKWSYITFVWEQGVGMKFYLNGVLYNSGANTTTLTYANITAAPMIGKKVDGGWSLLNGKIDGLTFWNSALTYPEVSTLYNAGSGMEYPYSSNIKALLPSASDSFGTNHGTLTNGCTFTTGKIGQAFSFDGINDMVTLTNNSLNINGDFSASAWVKYTIGSGIKTILSNNALLTSPTRQYGWGVYLNSNNILFQTYDGTSTVGSLSYAATLTSGTWYHITVTKSGTTKRIYLNGVEVANASVNNITYTATHRPTIGGQRYDATGMEYFSVSPIDAVNVWNKELTSTEVTELYNSGAGKQYPNY